MVQALAHPTEHGVVEVVGDQEVKVACSPQQKGVRPGAAGRIDYVPGAEALEDGRSLRGIGRRLLRNAEDVVVHIGDRGVGLHDFIQCVHLCISPSQLPGSVTLVPYRGRSVALSTSQNHAGNVGGS